MLDLGFFKGRRIVHRPITYRNVAFVGGVILWISDPRSRQSAQALADYFESQPGRYLDVEVVESEEPATGAAKPRGQKRFRVRAMPVRERHRNRLEDIARAEQERRADRYEHLYRFQPLRPGFWRVWGRTGVYETTEFSCTCQHWQVRLRGTGLVCCHSVALRRRMERSERSIAPSPSRRYLTPERLAADFD